MEGLRQGSGEAGGGEWDGPGVAGPARPGSRTGPGARAAGSARNREGRARSPEAGWGGVRATRSAYLGPREWGLGPS